MRNKFSDIPKTKSVEPHNLDKKAGSTFEMTGLYFSGDNTANICTNKV